MSKSVVKRSGYATKAERLVLHKYIILATLMMETLDEMDIEIPEFEAALHKSENIIDNIFEDGLDVMRTASYIKDVSEKVSTVIRKNYKPV